MARENHEGGGPHESIGVLTDLDLRRYVQDPAYREKLKSSGELSSVKYFVQLYELAAILQNEDLDWSPRQIQCLKKKLLVEFAKMNVDFSVLDKKDAAKLAEDEFTESENTYRHRADILEEINAANQERMKMVEKSEHVEIASFLNDIEYKLSFLEANRYLQKTRGVERLDVVRKIIDISPELELSAEQIETLARQFGNEDAYADLIGRAMTKGMIFPGGKSWPKLMKKWQNLGIEDTLKKLKEKYLGREFSNNQDYLEACSGFEDAVQKMIKELLQSKKKKEYIQ